MKKKLRLIVTILLISTLFTGCNPSPAFKKAHETENIAE